MSTKVTISYEHPHELEAVLKALAPLVAMCKVKPDKTPFQRAYLWMKDISAEEEKAK